MSRIHSFIHSGHFYSAPSSSLLLRGAPNYSTATVSEFHAEAHRQLQVKHLPKCPTWRLERESNPRLELCADVIVSAAARRSISVGGGGAPPVQKNRRRRRGVGGQKYFFIRFTKNFVLSSKCS